MTERRVYKPEEKMKIVMEGLSGTISVSDLCGKYEIKPARFYYWKDQIMNSSQYIFQNRGRKIDEDRIKAEKDNEIARLKATIAEVVQENLEIKKKIGERLQRRGQILKCFSENRTKSKIDYDTHHFQAAFY